jgi:tRNA (mo5U34)-methyltransferase
MENEPKKSLGAKILEMPYWYHRIELPDGNFTPGWSPINASKYGIPDDLTGKRVLDIGAWDGYWTWEALKRGASEVVAIDDFSDMLGVPEQPKREGWATFDLCREAFGFTEYAAQPKTAVITDEKAIQSDIEGAWVNDKKQKVCRMQMSIYKIANLGKFDIVFFFGTLYHLKHPYIALELISDICDGEIYIESAVIDDYTPYRNQVGRGYNDNDMVMEFYPGKQYGNNENNWWGPTLQCLGALVGSVGFKNIQAWPLTEKPKTVPECRGFIYGSKTEAENENVNKLAGVVEAGKKRRLSVAAVMSVPRLGFQDNSFCVFEGIVPLKIPLLKVQGAFWGQCLERGIQQQIDQGADAILTIDYDTIFMPEDVQNLVRLMIENPEADAIVPLQCGRSGMQTLMTMKTRSGKVREIIDREEFTPELTKIITGHFGLTLIRVSSLLKLPHPWFASEPAPDGQWGPGRIDDDIYFWKQMEKHRMNVFSANRIALGHLELVATWLDENLKPIYQPTSDFQNNGRPEKAWK